MIKIRRVYLLVSDTGALGTKYFLVLPSSQTYDLLTTNSGISLPLSHKRLVANVTKVLHTPKILEVFRMSHQPSLMAFMLLPQVSCSSVVEQPNRRLLKSMLFQRCVLTIICTVYFKMIFLISILNIVLFVSSLYISYII